MKPTEVMEHLGRFAEGDPEEVASMTPEEVRAELEREGVDVEAGLERMRKRLAEIRARAEHIRPGEER